jgi:hypothetical protein
MLSFLHSSELGALGDNISPKRGRQQGESNIPSALLDDSQNVARSLLHWRLIAPSHRASVSFVDSKAFTEERLSDTKFFTSS